MQSYKVTAAKNTNLYYWPHLHLHLPASDIALEILISLISLG
jgi:hypothetical protein